MFSTFTLLCVLAQPVAPLGACGPFSYCSTSPNSVGAGATISATGGLTVSNNDTTLTINGAPPQVTGIFFYGHGSGSIPFGDGLRCIDGQIFRLPVAMTNASGNLSYFLDVTNPSEPAGTFFPWSFWNFQFWYRDPSGPGGSGFNLSDAMTLYFCG